MTSAPVRERVPVPGPAVVAVDVDVGSVTLTLAVSVRVAPAASSPERVTLWSPAAKPAGTTNDALTAPLASAVVDPRRTGSELMTASTVEPAFQPVLVTLMVPPDSVDSGAMVKAGGAVVVVVPTDVVVVVPASVVLVVLLLVLDVVDVDVVVAPATVVVVAPATVVVVGPATVVVVPDWPGATKS